MKTNFTFRNKKIGDKVYHVAWGWMVIDGIDDYGIILGQNVYFQFNGKETETDANPTIYPYNPFEQNQERVVEVSDNGKDWKKRVLIAVKEEFAICWNSAENIENSKVEIDTTRWDYWREIQPQKQLTQEEKINLLWEKFKDKLENK